LPCLFLLLKLRVTDFIIGCLQLTSMNDVFESRGPSRSLNKFNILELTKNLSELIGIGKRGFFKFMKGEFLPGIDVIKNNQFFKINILFD